MQGLLIIILITLTTFGATAIEKITFSYGEVNTPPQVIVNQDDEITSGIQYDLAMAISDSTGLHIEFLKTPRARLEQQLLERFVDLNCASNPKWLINDSLIWSESLYDNPDMLINNIGIISIEQLSQFLTNSNEPTLIGTVLGYRYPKLEPFFLKGKLKRIDSLSPLISYQRFRRGDFPFFVIANTEASLVEKSENISAIVLENNELHCVFSPELPTDVLTKLQKAIHTLKENGTLPKILAKYGIN